MWAGTVDRRVPTAIMENMLTPRQEKLLNVVVDLYVKTAEPVSSKQLVSSHFSDVSSATIRNEMFNLEEAGYLSHIYTSSGRVPTDKAYRSYVDRIINSENIHPALAIQRKIREVLTVADNDAREINRAAANILARLSENLVIANIVEQDDFYKTGLASLFEFPEFREFDRIFNLASFFDNFESMCDRMERDLSGEDSDMRVVIGKENSLKTIQDETVILAKYNLPGNFTGSITLIGPTRMNYEKNIGLVRCMVNEINEKNKRHII